MNDWKLKLILVKDNAALVEALHVSNDKLTTRDKLKNLKTEHSSLNMNKNKLQTKIQKLEKVVSQTDSKITKLKKKENTDLNQNQVTLTDLASSLIMSGSPFTTMVSN